MQVMMKTKNTKMEEDQITLTERITQKIKGDADRAKTINDFDRINAYEEEETQDGDQIALTARSTNPLLQNSRANKYLESSDQIVHKPSFLS